MLRRHQNGTETGRTRLTYSVCVFASWLLWSGAGVAANCSTIDDAEARTCCERSLPTNAMQQNIRLTVADERGTISNLGAKLYWKRFDDGRSRVRIDLNAPPRQAGTVVLLTEKESDDNGAREPEVVLYQKGERRDRLISISALSGEMLGTDFSYEDFVQLFGTDANVNVVRLADEQYAGRNVVVVQSTPRDAAAAVDSGAHYTRVVTRFDAERCVPLTTQFFEESDFLRKELLTTPESIHQDGGRWVARELIMHDRARQSRSVLAIDHIDFEADIKDGFFTRAALKRGR
jgi:hypothetical protein